MEKYFLPCAYKSIFGIDCPICGFQRALLLLARGDVIASIKMYPPLLLILLLAFISLIHTLKPNRISKKFTLQFGVFVLVVVMINYTIKMLG